jgi:hypothetical protein
MSSSKYPKHCYAYVDNDDQGYFRYKDKDGNIDLDALDFAIAHVELLPTSKSNIQKVLSKLCFHKVCSKVMSVVDPDISLIDATRHITFYKANLMPTLFNTGTGGTILGPPSEAHGSAMLAFNQLTQEITYAIKFMNLTSPEVPGHFHIGDSASATPPVVDLPMGQMKNGSFVADGDFCEALISGKVYVNIHSEQFPLGEIRGQLLPAMFGPSSNLEEMEKLVEEITEDITPP